MTAGMIWLMIGAYLLMSIVTIPHRYVLSRKHSSEEDAWFTSGMTSIIWPIYYLYKISEAFTHRMTRPKTPHVSRRQKRLDRKAEQLAKARKVLAQVDVDRNMAIQLMKSELRELRTTRMVEWTDSFVALGGDRWTVESSVEQQRRTNQEAAERQRQYELDREARRSNYR